MTYPKELVPAIVRTRILAPDRVKAVHELLTAGYRIKQVTPNSPIQGMGVQSHWCERITGWQSGWLETADAASLYLCLSAELLINYDEIALPKELE